MINQSLVSCFDEHSCRFISSNYRKRRQILRNGAVLSITFHVKMMQNGAEWCSAYHYFHLKNVMFKFRAWNKLHLLI